MTYLTDFAGAVITYRRSFNGSVTSWGRNADRNKSLGGVPNSRHLYDLAADVVPQAGFPEALRLAHAKTLGLWLLVEADHDHLEPLELHP